jgi:D-glycero-beta-D-manno-heptose 1-phosphate adenylyltransferase
MSHWKNIETKYWKEAELNHKLHELKRTEKSLVFTNGCFDILHFGHIKYLSQAADLGDFLIIGLNSDDSIRNLKGESRPINDLPTRVFALASLQFVGAVVVFNELTPNRLIELIIPQVLVKGGDYDFSTIEGGEFVKKQGGLVTTIPFISGYSTTSIEQKIKHG